ncbi:Tektin-1 [Merluccius polli]|uniref:Tektin n=1 Tax=Merluccius polli TaxID=89951 RepID=A0AA47M8X0_MERPO|nr:Tektin-1 [Merluccius polli]
MALMDGPLRWRKVGGPNAVDVEAARSRSQRLTADCSRLLSQVDKTSQHLQQDAKQTLEQRVRDIRFLREELERRLEEVLEEIDALVAFKTRVERALEACSDPLRVTLLCLDERTKRAPVEQACDEVERELLREMEVFEGVASLLQRTLEQIIEQIRLNRSAKYHLEKDLKNKFQAQSIDDSCTLMTNHSLNPNHRPKDLPLSPPPSMAVSPEEWEGLSGINISRAEQEKANSASLRVLVDSLLEQTACDMRSQLQATASAFQRKIQETKTVKAQMEEHLARVQCELTSQKRNMEALGVAVAEKEIPLSVAQARLSARAQRPGTELCHDPAQARLLVEVQELTAYINKMRKAAALSATAQQSLVRCQLELEDNLEVKANSLYVDEVLCGQYREPTVIHHF